jgi:hypothetical protein
MGDLYFKEGNILDCEETVLCHQCNCVSKNSAGLAKQIYDKWERANVYKLDRGNELAGSILFSNNIPSISCNGDDIEIIPTHGPIICNMFAQIYPGRPRWGIDSKENRLKYFRTCLKSLIEYHFADYTGSGIVSGQENINNTYAFPYKIGCSLARGSWDQYLKQIEKFAKKITTHVTIYRL